MERFEQLYKLIASNQIGALRKALSEMNVVDTAAFLEELEREKMLLVFRVLPKDLAADVFSYVGPDEQRQIIEGISDKEVRAVIDELNLDDTVDFLEEVPANIVKKVMRNADREMRERICAFLKYPKESAAALMTVEFVELHDRLSVEKALDIIRATGLEKETLNILYAIDNTHHLTGYLDLYRLIVSPPDALIRDIMNRNVLSVKTLDDKELVAQTFSRYDLSAMPVVDHENRLVGVITVDDVVDVIQDENTEDMEIMAAITPSDREYLRTSVFDLAKHRVVWLLILMVSATVTGGIIKRFDDVLQSAVMLAAFIPMLMDTGGNCGSQSSVMVIRGLALGEIGLGDALKVLWKELRVGLLVGAALALINFGRVLFFEGVGLMVALAVSLSLYATVILAKVVGGLLPILAKRLKFDPAVMASPIITTLVDAFSLIIFFEFATHLLGIGA